MQFIAAGLMGELLMRIYHEAGGAPQYHADEYVVREEVGMVDEPSSAASARVV